MAGLAKGGDMELHIDELHSPVTDDIFMIVYTSCASNPRMWTITKPKLIHFHFKSENETLSLIFQLFCTRREGTKSSARSQYLGTCVLDVSQCDIKTYHMTMRDASSRPALYAGRMSVTFKSIPIVKQSHPIQSTKFIRSLYTAAESNLRWIDGFGPPSRALPPIVRGLKLVHSPYYINVLGMTLPAGAFCMIDTDQNAKRKLALKSYESRLQIALARNTMASAEFVQCVANMMSGTIKSKHIRCLAVLADFLTLHTKISVQYTPDVQMTPTLKGTERWDIPREPTADGSTIFHGDCEDYAREIYHHCKELKEWVNPNTNGSAIEAATAILHMYVPTIEQGAVDKAAHSKYITYDAPYRNHIWAALHPRYSWRTKCMTTIDTTHLFTKWPRQKCEKMMPMIHLEGTGEVYPIVTARNPGFIVKMQKKQCVVHSKYSDINDAETPDITLQCKHKSDFYKYPIACMTDAFANQGILDFTYITDNKYGVSIYDWARGQYKIKPSTIHSHDTMSNIRSVLTIERPIYAITTKSYIVKKHSIRDGYALRYGQKQPFRHVPNEASLAIYNVGGQLWHEIYFPLSSASGSASSNEVDCTRLLCI